MSRAQYENDKTGALEFQRGSDHRANTSARTDPRAAYNSRDRGQCYSLVWEHPVAVDGQYCFYLKNTSNDKQIVVSSIIINSDTAGSRFKLHYVTGTAGDGIDKAPTNLNRASPHAADVTSKHDGAGTPISGLTQDGEIGVAYLAVNAPEEMRLEDRLRLGQNNAIALEFEEGSLGSADAAGVVHFYLE